MKILMTVLILGSVLSLFGILMQGNQAKSIDQEVLAHNGLHWHANLSIIVNGQKQLIPANIGLEGEHKPFHTHEDAIDGVLHLEFSGLVKKADTKLGNFFNNWGKSFSSTTILTNTISNENQIKFFINGQQNDEYENYEVKDGDRIEIIYG